jgi:hypothetical protein
VVDQAVAPASGWWQVRAADEPALDEAHLSSVLQAMLGCDPQTSARYVAALRAGGQVVVREGHAEACKQVAARLAAWGIPVTLTPVEAS